MSTQESADNCPPLPEPPPGQDRRQMPGCIAGALAHIGWAPILITGVLRQLLITHFADPGNIEEPQLRDVIWQEGPTTGILIESVHRWRGDLVEKRPAALIKRNAYRNTRLLLNDQQAADMRGDEHFATVWVGSHTIFSIHGTGASCEILATEIQRDLTQYAPAVKRTLGLMKLQVAEVGDISIVQEAPQNFIVPITVGWAYQETWKLSAEALRLTGIRLKIEPRDI